MKDYKLYLILIIVLGGITVTTVLADTYTIATYPYTITDGSSNSRFVITSSGYVGIGTNNPVQILEVKIGTNQNFYVGSSFLVPGSMTFSALNDANTANIPMEWRASSFLFENNVGIGTTSPAQPLDVSGNIRLTGNIVSPNDICIGSC